MPMPKPKYIILFWDEYNHSWEVGTWCATKEEAKREFRVFRKHHQVLLLAKLETLEHISQ